MNTSRLSTSPSKPLPRYLWAVLLAWIRAKLLKRQFEKAKRRALRIAATKRKESKPLTATDGIETVIFLELWLASLHVVVEGYQESFRHSDSLLSDAKVDRLLDSQRRTRLKRFRNKVFHVVRRDHPDVLAVLDNYKDFIAWGEEVMKETGRVLFGSARASRA